MVSPSAALAPLGVMTTVCRADGSILVQNDAARAAFATVPGDPAGPGALQRHFLDPDAAERLLRLAAGGGIAREQLAVYTNSGT